MRLSLKTLSLVAAAGVVAVTTGCTPVRNQAVAGSCFLDVTQPLGFGDNGGASKMGKSSASTILGWVGTGDCSINAAAKAGGVSKISWVDYHSKHILGIIGDTTTIVYGE